MEYNMDKLNTCANHLLGIFQVKSLQKPCSNASTKLTLHKIEPPQVYLLIFNKHLVTSTYSGIQGVEGVIHTVLDPGALLQLGNFYP